MYEQGPQSRNPFATHFIIISKVNIEVIVISAYKRAFLSEDFAEGLSIAMRIEEVSTTRRIKHSKR